MITAASESLSSVQATLVCDTPCCTASGQILTLPTGHDIAADLARGGTGAFLHRKSAQSYSFPICRCDAIPAKSHVRHELRQTMEVCRWRYVATVQLTEHYCITDRRTPLALYSENSPPVDLADRLAASIPHGLQEGGLSQRATKAIVAGDKYVPWSDIRASND